jgi:hypothetical protein
MAGYTEHNKIAELAGIPSAISEEINRFMDDTNPPKDFEDHNTDNKVFVCGHLNVSIRTMMGSEKLQGRGKKEWVQKKIICNRYWWNNGTEGVVAPHICRHSLG